MGPRVLGIDPGTLHTGYGLLDGDPPSALAWGVFSFRSRAPLGERLLSLHDDLTALLERWGPTEVALEDPYIPRQEKSVRSALAVGQAQGVALLVAARFHLPVYRYTPAQVKMAVAEYGRGAKEQVGEMVRLLLGLEETPRPSDAADALAVALCHLHYRSLARLLSPEKPRR